MGQDEKLEWNVLEEWDLEVVEEVVSWYEVHEHYTGAVLSVSIPDAQHCL